MYAAEVVAGEHRVDESLYVRPRLLLRAAHRVGVRVAFVVDAADLRVFADDAVPAPGHHSEGQDHADAALLGRAEDAGQPPVAFVILECAGNIRGVVVCGVETEGIEVAIPRLTNHVENAQNPLDGMVIELAGGPLLQRQRPIAHVVYPCPKGEAMRV